MQFDLYNELTYPDMFDIVFLSAYRFSLLCVT